MRRTRLATGLVLFAYVTVHLLNHVAGIHSIAAMETGAVWVVQVLHLAPVTWTLYLALTLHFLLALWAVYARRRLWPMPVADALQLVLGLSIIPLLAGHAIGTRLGGEWFKVYYSHTYVLVNLGVLAPSEIALRHGLALIVAWGHGCIGMYHWLRLKPGWPRWQPYAFAVALLLPTLALCGYYAGLRQVRADAAATPGWTQAKLAELNAPEPAARASLERVQDTIIGIWAAGLAAALGARGWRRLMARRRGIVRITYPGDRVVEVAPGTSVLEASQAAGIAHAAVCGGRGRCSTCRVRISAGLDWVPDAAPGERAVLARVNAAPNVRLACQLRPPRDVAVVPLLAPSVGTRAAREPPGRTAQGQEREIAILFADLRGFTEIAEHKLPYDVVFMLNRYFEAMGRAVEHAGGQVDKFIGDGVMALFGTAGDGRLAARQALRAAKAMSASLADLNATLRHDLRAPLRIGIGIHVGPAIIGEMGYGRTISLTAIGDTVNTASRLEAMTKEFDAELVVSAAVLSAARIELPAAIRREQTAVRGRQNLLAVAVVDRARELEGLDESP
ncbi:MAG: adenylate/guanylate cyclase domain-containing protein [Alphaproteobacteria bacterium]|nr:adenylate/guanylate cyclase domain-containing protein [Alphaproteobacteria bacterium]